MKTAQTVLIVMLANMLFEVMPGDEYRMFLLSDHVDTPYFFTWNVIGRLTLLYYIRENALTLTGMDRSAGMAFVCITIADLLDYVLTGNHLYGSQWMSFNTLSLIGFCVYIILLQWKSSSALSLD